MWQKRVQSYIKKNMLYWHVNPIIIYNNSIYHKPPNLKVNNQKNTKMHAVKNVLKGIPWREQRHSDKTSWQLSNLCLHSDISVCMKGCWQLNLSLEWAKTKIIECVYNTDFQLSDFVLFSANIIAQLLRCDLAFIYNKILTVDFCCAGVLR